MRVAYMYLVTAVNDAVGSLIFKPDLRPKMSKKFVIFNSRYKKSLPAWSLIMYKPCLIQPCPIFW